jgi:hypothetical protein
MCAGNTLAQKLNLHKRKLARSAVFAHSSIFVWTGDTDFTQKL